VHPVQLKSGAWVSQTDSTYQTEDTDVSPAVCQPNKPQKTDTQNASKPDRSNREKGMSQFIPRVHWTSISADKLSFQYEAK